MKKDSKDPNEQKEILNETLNDKLNNISIINETIQDNIKYCIQFSEKLKDKNHIEELKLLIQAILKEIENLKKIQYQISKINYENFLEYNGQSYRILELIKIKEQFKLQSDFIGTILNSNLSLKDIDFNLYLHSQQTILKKELNNINKLIRNFNQKVTHE